MKKQIYVYLCFILTVLCVFPIISFAKNVTEIKISVHEIKVNCDENGSFIVAENNYTNIYSFFVGKDGSITIEAIPNSGYKIDSIECEPKCENTLDNGKLIITNINDNIVVNIRFIPKEIPPAGGLDDTTSIGNQDIKEDIANRNKEW